MHSARDFVSTRWPALDVEARRGRLQNSRRHSPGLLGDAGASTAEAARRAADGLIRRDTAVWSDDPAVKDTIAKRLGWLDSPILMAESLNRLRAFADGVKADGITDVVLLGMGGSSLAPEVLRAIIGPAPGWPVLHVLDTTDPAAIAAVTTAPERTLYLLASKSGTTIEPNSLAAHFQDRLQKVIGAQWPAHFVAITDEGTELARRARTDGFRELFINPSDIGGRYSALSFFGLVPAALMGQDVDGLVGWGLAMLAAAEGESAGPHGNPAVSLGLVMGTAARSGRDKLTLVLPAALEPFGLWVEQLVAESTGKRGHGVVPIAGEPLGAAESYGADRLFVRFRVQGASDAATDTAADALKEARMPIVEIELPDISALGAEFVRWEIATAVAGALLAINPFDEPNVQQAKDATGRLLNRFTTEKTLPLPTPDVTADNGARLTLSTAARQALAGRPAEAFLTLVRRGDYVGLLAYVGPDPSLAEELQALRRAVRTRTRTATMFGYGPRYLHSTGQLHKGGPNTGVFHLNTA
jgi:glucose-6-phosphate isomerase